MTVKRVLQPKLVELRNEDINDDAKKNLAMAIILRAIRDVVNYRDSDLKKKRVIYEEAYEWIYKEQEPVRFSNGSRPQHCTCDILEKRNDVCTFCKLIDRGNSFEVECAILGWSVSCLRERIKELKVEDLKRLIKVVGV